MRVLVVEDEAVIARRIVRLVTEIAGEEMKQILTVSSFHEAIDRLEHHPVDLVFLDLNLNGRDGFQILQRAASGAFHTVVVSAHTERALEAFEYGVLDFIGKPFGRERLEKSLARFSGQLKRHECTRFLAVRKHAGLFLAPLDKVLYIKGANTYSELYLEDGAVELHSKSLEKLSAILPPDFQRIHKSYIVDMTKAKALRSFAGSRYELELSNGVMLPIGRTRLKAIKDLLM